MKKYFSLAAIASILLFCTAASAASMAANVSFIWELNGKIYLQMTSIQWDGAATSCTPATPMFMIDPTTPVGRAQLSLVLTAKEDNHRTYLVGDGVCVSGGPNGYLAESLIGVQLQP